MVVLKGNVLAQLQWCLTRDKKMAQYLSKPSLQNSTGLSLLKVI